MIVWAGFIVPGCIAVEEDVDAALDHGGDVGVGDGVAEEGVFADLAVDEIAELV